MTKEKILVAINKALASEFRNDVSNRYLKSNIQQLECKVKDIWSKLELERAIRQYTGKSIIKGKNMKLGQVIRTFRRQESISLEELSKKMGVTGSYLSLIENDKRNISVVDLQKLATIFKIPLTLMTFLAFDKDTLDKTSADALNKLITDKLGV